MASEHDSTPLESVDNSHLPKQASYTNLDTEEPPSLDSADRMEVSPAPVVQNGPQSSLHTSAVPSDAGTPAIETGDLNGAAPYGTRSRNRTGASRPNYAEDKELDQLIEANGKITRPVPLKAAAPSTDIDSEAADLERNSNGAPRRGFAAVNTTAPEVNGNTPLARDLIPGTSTFSANPSVNGNGPAPQSKKRKQPGANTTLSATGTANHSVSRMPRSSVGVRQHHETNMMTFEGCGARLNSKKELKADDGTILSVNGMCPQPVYLGDPQHSPICVY